MTVRPELSIVVPVLNEETVLPIFISAIQTVLETTELTYEILFVDDGSTDATLAVVAEMARGKTPIRCVSFSRNFGKEAAVTAGLAASMGEAVVIMDVDLQDPPELLHEFIAGWRYGYDVVYGVRQDRSSDGMMKRTSAAWFYRLFNWLSDTKLPANAGDYRLMSRKVVDALLLLPERGRFMKGIMAWVGFKSLAVPFVRPKRAAGTTKWSPSRLTSFAFDGIFAFSVVPLRLSLVIGALMFTLSMLYLFVILFRTLIFGVDTPGYASLLSSVLAIGGLQMFLFGIFGEYLGRLVIEAKQRPLYIVSQYINLPAKDQ